MRSRLQWLTIVDVALKTSALWLVISGKLEIPGRRRDL
jgi:hypothetical protein